jgi:hypothetical protein
MGPIGSVVERVSGLGSCVRREVVDWTSSPKPHGVLIMPRSELYGPKSLGSTMVGLASGSGDLLNAPDMTAPAAAPATAAAVGRMAADTTVPYAIEVSALPSESESSSDADSQSSSSDDDARWGLELPSPRLVLSFLRRR